MPFTLSHSAAVLPLLRSRRLSATGLIIGTMSPDFEYFLRMNVQGIYGHTVPGIFYFDIPVALIAAFVFHGIIKKNLVDQLPLFLQKRFQEVRNFNFFEYIRDHKTVFVLSVIIGAVTHIIWDAFTHGQQYFVLALPAIYEGRTVPFMGVNYPLWYALQYMSTIVGGLFVAGYVLLMKPAAGIFNRPRIIYWVLLFLMISVILVTRMQFYNSPDEKYVVIVITIISSFCIGITILGFVPFKRRETGS